MEVLKAPDTQRTEFVTVDYCQIYCPGGCMTPSKILCEHCSAITPCCGESAWRCKSSVIFVCKRGHAQIGNPNFCKKCQENHYETVRASNRAERMSSRRETILWELQELEKRLVETVDDLEETRIKLEASNTLRNRILTKEETDAEIAALN
jgi:hypothetical protein